ncbi:MAG: penicillin acylase family protein [Lutibacter sp.]|nr:MAG: penicillin acylase family protein [Lutibacter sp.]
MQKLFKILLGLIIILFIAGYFFINSLKPDYKGSKTLSNLTSEVTINYDDYGIPHIYADNQEDAQRALGYAHAQDRLWQMELLRRIASGRLSEILGEATLESDLFFAGLLTDEASEKTVSELDKNSTEYKLTQAYIDGINEFVKNGSTPIEYRILGLEKKEFTLKDTYNIFAYMAFSFAAAHKTDPVLSSLQAKLGNEYVKELGVDINPNSTLIHNYNKANEEISVAINNIMNSTPIPPFIGSNSWIVAPEKSKNGKVLFANDPHIGFSSPSVWYEAHIKTPDFESYGYYLGGFPFPTLSHNRDFAYGLTMFENDDIDFYQEENHPTDATKYKTADGYKSYTTIDKTIKVKDAEDVKITVRSTHHGPIMNDVISTIDAENPIAMSWIYTKLKNEGINAMYLVSRAKNKTEFEKGVAMIHAPGLNFMYGDAKDNIAWYAVGKLYKFSENVNPKFVLDGASGKEDIVEYLDFNQNPQAHNPSWNYVYSANNQPDSIAGMLYPGYYLPEDRAKRIVELLEPKNDWSKEDYMKMLLDSKSSMAPSLVKHIVKNISENLTTDNEKIAFETLKNWDGNFIKSSIGATIYTKFIHYFLKNTFEDEIGEKIFADFVDTHLMARVINDQLQRENSVWWDNINTKDIKENKSKILSLSFTETVASLENQLGNDVNSWTWNRVHKLTHKHPLGTVKLLDYLFNFNVGEFEVDGANEVINNLMYNVTNNKVNDITAGPSTRRIVDFSDVENSLSILPTGNSGNPFSKHYRDQAQMYADGKFRKMKMNKEEIERVSTKLILKPKK